jgi:hypothetical protein
MLAGLIQSEIRAGEPVSAGEIKIVPFSKVWRLRIPGRLGGLIWNRPVSIVTISPDGEEQLHQLRDQTRQVQIALLGSGIIAVLLTWGFSQLIRSLKEQSHE